MVYPHLCKLFIEDYQIDVTEKDMKLRKRCRVGQARRIRHQLGLKGGCDVKDGKI